MLPQLTENMNIVVFQGVDTRFLCVVVVVEYGHDRDSGIFLNPTLLTPLKFGKCFLYECLTSPEPKKVVSEGDDFLFALEGDMS